MEQHGVGRQDDVSAGHLRLGEEVGAHATLAAQLGHVLHGCRRQVVNYAACGAQSMMVCSLSVD